MKTLQWLLAGVLVGVIAVAFRDLERGRWLQPALPRGAAWANDEEPLLGYDGMNQETLLQWLSDSDFDDATLQKVIRYEEAHLGREPVLSALHEMVG